MGRLMRIEFKNITVTHDNVKKAMEYEFNLRTSQDSHYMMPSLPIDKIQRMCDAVTKSGFKVKTAASMYNVGSRFLYKLLELS